MPARLGTICRVFREYGGDIEKPKKGSHWKARRGGARPYPMPAHNGPKEEIPDVYIRGLCRHFGIDEDEFRSKL